MSWLLVSCAQEFNISSSIRAAPVCYRQWPSYSLLTCWAWPAGLVGVWFLWGAESWGEEWDLVPAAFRLCLSPLPLSTSGPGGTEAYVGNRIC